MDLKEFIEIGKSYEDELKNLSKCELENFFNNLKKLKTIEIYTDGGCRGNPGLGAWAVYIETTNEIYGGTSESTTNNEMELMAINSALAGLSYTELEKIKKVTIHSDSNYAIKSITEWSNNWIKDGSIETRPNKDLIKGIRSQLDKYKLLGIQVEFIKVPGHSGVSGNETADQYLNKLMDEVEEGKL